MSVTKLVLVRHGESDAQATGILAGHTHCRGLSDRGRAQVGALAARLGRGELGTVDVLYSSVMERAVETASIIAPAIGHADPVQDCGLCELHPGEADGMSWQQIQERWPTPDGTGWDPFVQEIAEAETWEAMGDRIRNSMQRLAVDHDGATVVVACHGGVIAHAMHAFLGTPLNGADVAWTVAENASITEFVLDASLTDWRSGRWGLIRYNDHAHLLDIN